MSRKQFQTSRLPPHLASDPELLAWRIDNIEQAQQETNQRLEELERSPMEKLQDASEKLPLGKMIGLGSIAALAAAGHISPEQTKALIAKLIGVDF
jgi:hypothetical protein